MRRQPFRSPGVDKVTNALAYLAVAVCVVAAAVCVGLAVGLLPLP